MKIRTWFIAPLLVSCQARGFHLEESRVPIDGLFPKLCETLLLQDPEAGQVRVVVLREAQPIYQTFALRVLRGVLPLDPKAAEEDDRRDRELVNTFQREVFDFATQSSDCMFEAEFGPQAQEDGAVLLALSPIIRDPFAPGSRESAFGLFARLWLEGAGPSWFWIDLARTGETWNAVDVHALLISE